MPLFDRYDDHNHSTLPQELSSSLSSNTQQLVMVVDDEADIAKILGKALHLKGLNVETFTDPVKALEEFKKKIINIITITMKMKIIILLRMMIMVVMVIAIMLIVVVIPRMIIIITANSMTITTTTTKDKNNRIIL